MPAPATVDASYAPRAPDGPRDGVFTVRSPVFFDELDAVQFLHNARFSLHVERALSLFYATYGGRWEPDMRANPDQFIAVRAFEITFDAPFVGVGDLLVELWVERLGRTSCTYGFRCLNGDGSVVHARGTRTIVKLDPDTQRPVPWSEAALERHRPLLRQGSSDDDR